MLRDVNSSLLSPTGFSKGVFLQQKGKKKKLGKKKTYLKIEAQRTVKELQESENCLRNCKQRIVISGKYFKNPMETDQIIFYELSPLSHIS